MTSCKFIGLGHDFEAEREFFEERAGILEFDGGFARDEAERRARVETLAYYFEGDANVILRKAAAQGVQVQLLNGRLLATGPAEARTKWTDTLERFRTVLVPLLKPEAPASRR